MFYRLGEFATRYRWQVIGVWALLFLASGIFAPRAISALKSGFGEADTESRLALRTLERDLDWNSSVITIVFSSEQLKASDPEFAREAEENLERVRQVPHVERIVSPFNPPNPRMVSPDGHTAFAQIYLDTNLHASQELVSPIRERLRPAKLDTRATGGIAIFTDLNTEVEKDLQRAEMVTLPLVFIALLLVFGSLVAAGIPVIMGVVSVTITLAFIYFVAQVTEVSVFALNITSFLGLGIAIDYSLFIVSRYREEAAHLGWGKEAIAKTVATAGVAITFSAVTTILGLSGLFLFKFMMLSSIGLGGIGVILVSLLMALTLMPALLSVVGERINSLTLIPRWRGGGGFWAALASRVMSRPLLVLFPVLLLLLALGYPFLRVKMGAPWEQTLPASSESRQGWEKLQQSFGAGELSPILVAVTSPTGILQPSNTNALYDFTRKLGEDSRIARVDSIVTVDPRITKEQYLAIYSRPELIPPQVKELLNQLARDKTTLVRVVTTLSVNSDEAKQLVQDIRQLSPKGDLKVQVTGATADLMDAVDMLYTDFPRALIFIMFTTYIALLVLFRSLILPLKAILMNVLSITASYGALVFVFQEGHLRQVLHFNTMGYTEAVVPILMFCILFGLSMDYEVFLLSRVKEVYQATADNTVSVAQGLQRSGGVITSAALILVLVAAGFSTGEITIIKALGFGTALAIFIDASIVRALLVPALMRIMGDLNWWAPRFIKRIIPDIGRLP